MHHHPLAAQQGVKPGQRRHGDHHITGLYTAHHRCLCFHRIRIVHGLLQSQPPFAVATGYIRVRLVDDKSIWKLRPCCLQQPHIGMHAPFHITAKANGCVIFHLARHQHHLPPCTIPLHGGVWLQVVLGQPVLHDAFTHLACTLHVVRCAFTVVEQIFQLRGLTGVKVNTLGIQHKRLGRYQVRAQAHRAHKTIFHAQQAHARLLCQLLHTCGRHTTPAHQAVVFHRLQRSSLCRVFDEHHLLWVQRQHGPQVCRLPAPKAHRNHAPCITLCHLLLLYQPAHHIRNLATLVGIGV